MSKNDQDKHLVRRGERGRLMKGSKLGAKKTLPEVKIMRDVCRDKLTEAAYRVATETRDQYKKRVNDNQNASALDTFVANALAKNNGKFITWLFDQAVGRPKQVDIDNAQRPIEIKLSYDPTGARPAVSYPADERIEEQKKLE